MDLNKLIKERVRKIVRNQRGGESTYEGTVDTLNNMAKVAQGLKIPDTSIPSGSTSGSIPVLIDDITGFVEHTLNTVMDAVIAADAIVALPSNLGKAYNEPLAHQNFTF